MEKEIINTLKDTPKKIVKLSGYLLANRKMLVKKEERIKNWEIKQLADISAELDDKGKPLYSNETKRQAELLARKTKDQIVQENLSCVEFFKQEIAELEIEIACLESLQKNYRAICRILGDG